MFCGDCGSPMFSMSRPDLAAAYTCGTYHKRGLKGCTSHHIRVDVLDELLKSFIRLLKENCQSMIEELQKSIDEQPEREEQLGATLSDIETRLNEARAKLKVIYKEKTLIDSGFADSKSRTKAALYDEMEEELLETVDKLEKQFGDLNSLRNTMIETNRKAKTVIEVFDDILKKEKLDKRDIGLVVERITVYEDRLNIKLKSDVDTLLSLTSEEHIVNFNCGSKDISSITIKSKNHLDKVFTVNIINNGDPSQTTSEKWQIIQLFYVGFGQKDGLGLVHIDGNRAFYRAYSRGVKGFLEKKNHKQYISANGKISICFDIFPFVFDILPFAVII